MTVQTGKKVAKQDKIQSYVLGNFAAQAANQ